MTTADLQLFAVGLFDVRGHAAAQNVLYIQQYYDVCRLYRPRPHLMWSNLSLSQRPVKLVLSRGYNKPLLTGQS